MNKKGFIKTFSIPELKSIFGKGGTKIFILIIILLTSLILIGVANGSKEYLNKKMESPWIKFIDIETKFNNWQELDEGIRDFNRKGCIGFLCNKNRKKECTSNVTSAAGHSGVKKMGSFGLEAQVML